MAQESSKNIRLTELQIEKMLKVADIILMAQRAEPTELRAIKAGLKAEFGDDWRDFKPSEFLTEKHQINRQP